jgi:maleylpyruvate isomerase
MRRRCTINSVCSKAAADHVNVKLHGFFRSGSSHRLRIALNLKGLAYEYIAVNLRSEEHLSARYKALNPQGFVPTLETDGEVLIQSPAIVEWLEERFPTPPLLPADPRGRARVRALAAIVGCDIHPVNNRRILEYLRGTLGCDEGTINTWCATWITAGFDTIEALIAWIRAALSRSSSRRQARSPRAGPRRAVLYPLAGSIP